MVTQHNCDTMPQPQLIRPAHPFGPFSIYCRPCLEIPFSYQDMLKYVQYILQRETWTHKEVMSLIPSLKYVLYTLLQDIPCTIVQFVCLGGLPFWIGHTVNFTKARLELVAADLVIDRWRKLSPVFNEGITVGVSSRNILWFSFRPLFKMVVLDLLKLTSIKDSWWWWGTWQGLNHNHKRLVINKDLLNRDIRSCVIWDICRSRSHTW